MLEPVMLRLTPEELYLLQGTLGIAALPGFEADLLAGLNDTQRTQALRTAAHTLRARGLVGRDEVQRPRMNPALAEMLLDYAHPRSTIFVDTYIVSTRVIPFLYVIGNRGIYEQCQPESDVLQLRVLDQGALWKRLYLRLGQNELFDGEEWEGQIIQRTLNEGVRMAREDQEAAYRHFSHCLPQALAGQLAAAYHTPKVVQYMARWEQAPTAEHPLPDAALTIVQGQEWSCLLWVEEPQKGEEALVTLRPALNDFLQAYVVQVLSSHLNE